MILPKPPLQYNPITMSQILSAIEREDARNQKLDAPKIVTASDGSRWRVVVSTLGVLSTVAA